MKSLSLRTLTLAVSTAVAALSGPVAQAAESVKIGVVTFLSGPAAGPFGIPSRNAAEILVEGLNAGKVPAPHATKGFGGAPVQLVFVDEAGSTTTQVSEYRNLVQRQNVDIVVGYISSGNCLAVAPVAEELKKVTVIFDCGTPRLLEENAYKYVFRTGAHAGMDSVAAGLYVAQVKPTTKTFAGINQNYAWGQDSWSDFEATMKVKLPAAKSVTSQMPKLFAGQYGTEISALMAANPEVIHSSFWNGDLEALILQAAPRGLFKKSMVVLSAGETAIHKLGKSIPDGTVIGARGPHSVFAPDTEINKWFQATYRDRYSTPPNYASYHMAQAILGAKTAYEKAKAAAGGADPTQEQIIAAFEGLSFEGPSGRVDMRNSKGHQAIQDTAYGMTKMVKGELTITNIKRFKADEVNPPEGVKSSDWIASGLKK
jgi:branched-chain amino acid transport system substrate-binding protein